VDKFAEYAEGIPDDDADLREDEHPTTFHLHSLAKRLGVYLIGGMSRRRTSTFPIRSVHVCVCDDCWRCNVLYRGSLPGSFPERAGDKLYNTCVAFDREGTIMKKLRKVHLFDIDVPNGVKFQESATLSPGDSLAILGELARGSLLLALAVTCGVVCCRCRCRRACAV
jgi:omega-amidase